MRELGQGLAVASPAGVAPPPAAPPRRRCDQRTRKRERERWMERGGIREGFVFFLNKGEREEAVEEAS